MMIKKLILLILYSSLILLVGCSDLFQSYQPEVKEEAPREEEESIDLKTKADFSNEKQELSYALGVVLGRQIRLFKDLDQEVLMFGLNQGYKGGEVLFTDEELSNIIITQQQLAIREVTQTALVRSKSFLEANAKKEDVVSLDSGIQYKVLVEGTGPKPKLEDTIEVHYKGSLINGVVFDSSYARNQTAVFPIDGVIQGWQEVIPLMSVGSHWEVVIPPELAYGEQGAGDTIGPNEVLIFEINLLSIQK